MRRPVLAALSLALACSAPRADAAEPACNRWDLDATCKTSVSRVGAGESFSATMTVKNSGDVALVNVVLLLRGDLGAKPTGDTPSPLQTVVERLEPGDSKEISGTFASDQVGVARIIGSTRDAIGWAAAGCACTVDVLGLPAIQSEIDDRPLAEGAVDVGTFYVGDTFRYVLTVGDDGGSAQTPDLKVVFTLPKELEFVSGTGEKGVTISGEGQSASTSPFSLAPKETLKIELRVKVLASPPSNFVQTRASIQTVTGIELEQKTESTTLR
jgi:hypothetical protein